MSDPSYWNEFQRNDTIRSLNEALPRAKTPFQGWSAEELTIEGWCQKSKGPDVRDSLLQEVDEFQFPDDDSFEDEHNQNVFKNALVNLSEGLASMHRQDLINTKNNFNNMKNKSENPKEKNSQIAKSSINKVTKTSVDECPEKDKENFVGIVQQSEPNLLAKKTKEFSYPGQAATLPVLDLKFFQQNGAVVQDYNPSLVDLVAKPNFKEDNKRLADKLEGNKDSYNGEYAMKSAKTSVYGSEIGSTSQIETDLIDSEKPNLPTKKYHILIKRQRNPKTQRSTRRNSKEDIRANRSYVPSKQAPSPHDTFNNSDSVKLNKRESTPGLLHIQNQKVLLPPRDLKNLNLQVDGIGQHLAKTKDGNDLNQSTNRKLNGTVEIRTRSLRTVINQALKDTEAPPLYTLNLKGNSMMKNFNDENIKDSVGYILSLYKSNANQQREKTKVSDASNFKVMDCFKRSTYQPKSNTRTNEGTVYHMPLREKTMNSAEIANRLTSRSQNKPDIAYRVKVVANNYDEKRLFFPGKVNLNEMVFQ